MHEFYNIISEENKGKEKNFSFKSRNIKQTKKDLIEQIRNELNFLTEDTTELSEPDTIFCLVNLLKVYELEKIPPEFKKKEFLKRFNKIHNRVFKKRFFKIIWKERIKQILKRKNLSLF